MDGVLSDCEVMGADVTYCQESWLHRKFKYIVDQLQMPLTSQVMITSKRAKNKQKAQMELRFQGTATVRLI